LTLLRVALSVAENVVGAPLDGSDSSITRTARGNGAATADVNVAVAVSNQTISSARMSPAKAAVSGNQNGRVTCES